MSDGQLLRDFVERLTKPYENFCEGDWSESDNAERGRYMFPKMIDRIAAAARAALTSDNSNQRGEAARGR